jgi:hypothetical protein
MRMRSSVLLESFNALMIIVLVILFIRSVAAHRPDYLLLAGTITFSIYWIARRIQKT